MLTSFAFAAAALATAPAIRGADAIKRLDGSMIPISEAAALADQSFRENNVTGAQVAVLNDGKLVWSQSYGLRGKAPDLAMDSQTMTWAASITKSVFATYVMLLSEQGKLNLDRPVALQFTKPLDQYEAYKVDAIELVKDPRWQKVTPRMLLSHTSGLANFAAVEPDKRMHLHSTPGSTYLYSGQGLNLLQVLIEEQQGKPLDVLMNQAIFEPTGMTRSGMRHRTEFGDNIADRFDKDGKFLSQTRRNTRAAGSMTTTAEDLSNFLSALFQDRILKSSTRAEMFRPWVKIRTLHQFSLKPNEPEGKEAKEVGLAYGAGWGLLTHTKFGRAVFKEGHGDGAQTFMIFFERSKSGMILLTNSDNGEFSFRPLLEKILGDTVSPWEWHGYTREYIAAARN